MVFKGVGTMEEKKEKKPAEPEVQDSKVQDCKLQDEDLDRVAGGCLNPDDPCYHPCKIMPEDRGIDTRGQG